MKKIFVISALFMGLLVAPLLVKSEANLASKLVGKILLAVEDRGKTYFVHTDGNRYQITKETALPIFQKLALGINNENLNEIPLGDVGIDAEVEVVDTTPEVTPQPVILSCDNTSFNSQIAKLTDDLYKAKADIESYKKVVADNNLGSAEGLPVVEVVKEIKIVPDCKNGIGGINCSIDFSYYENGKKTNADMTISTIEGEGRFISGGGCKGGVNASSDGVQRKGNILACSTYVDINGVNDGLPHIKLGYAPLTIGQKIITVIANGITATSTVSGQLDICVGHIDSKEDDAICNPDYGTAKMGNIRNK